jgi:hypothetical protein
MGNRGRWSAASVRKPTPVPADQKEAANQSLETFGRNHQTNLPYSDRKSFQIEVLVPNRQFAHPTK